MSKVLGISGSPRKGGNSDILLKSFLKGARRGGCAAEAFNFNGLGGDKTYDQLALAEYFRFWIVLIDRWVY